MKNKVTAIVAVDGNNAIGKGEELLIKNVVDQAFFVGFTMGKTCLVGYNTALTLPELKGRKCVLDVKDVMRTLSEMTHQASTNEVVVIGGAKSYAKYADQVDELYITKFNTVVEGGDVFFPIDKYAHLTEKLVVYKNKDFIIERWSK